MKQDNEKRLKDLSAKLLFMKLTQLSQVKMQEALGDLNKHKLVSKNTERGLRRLTNLVTNKEQNCLRKSLKTWFINAFDFVKENATVNELVIKKATFKSMSKFFYKWRSAYFDSLRKYDHKLEAITLLKSITSKREDLKVRIALSTWKQRVERYTIMQVKLKHIMRRKSSAALKQGLKTWFTTLQETKQSEKYESLNAYIVSNKMRQKVFYAWKIVIQDLKAKRDLEKFFEWKKYLRSQQKV